MKLKSKKTFISISMLVIVLIILGIFASQSFSLVPSGSEVWIPEYGVVKCEQTRLECYPGICSDTNPEWKEINQKGESFWCGAGYTNPPISDANYYDGCTIYIKSSGIIFDFSSTKKCNADGSNCENANFIDSSSLTSSSKSIKIFPYQKLYVNPNLVTSEYRIVAPVYGLSIEGAIKPQYSDRCNLASLLDDNQVAVLKDSPDYLKVNLAGEINPGVFPVTFITGYGASYFDQRIIIIDGDSWFVEDIGWRCKVEQDTNNRWIVTNTCIPDNAIECFPNIANCNSEGKLIFDDTGKTCVPGTLIGSSTSRVAISSTEACKIICNSDGIPVNYDCVNIPHCSSGEVLSSNYECVESTRITEAEKCEAQDGIFKETLNKDGTTTYECSFADFDPTLVFIGGFFVIVLGMMYLVSTKVKK